MVVSGSTGAPDCSLSRPFPQHCSWLNSRRERTEALLCTVKRGHFVEQAVSVTVMEASRGKTVELSNGAGSLFLAIFAISEGFPANDLFASLLLPSGSSGTAAHNRAAPNRGGEGGRLWLHLMDGLGFPGKNKANVSVRFEIVEYPGAPPDDADTEGAEDEGEVVQTVTSSSSVHARHLVWDQKMEMHLEAEVLQALTAVRGRAHSPIASPQKKYSLRVSMWQRESVVPSGSGDCGTLIASAERSAADVLAPLLPRGRASGSGSSGPTTTGRHQIVFPLQLLASLPPSERMSSSSSSSDARLRVGILLLPPDEHHCPAPPEGNTSLGPPRGNDYHHAAPPRPGSPAVNAELFMSKGGRINCTEILFISDGVHCSCQFLL